MDEQQQKLIDRIQQAQNILVTVSANPSVDQLAATIGLTLALNKLGKHGTAVFSGQVPSTIEFLKPEETLEKTTDSLRDFIIALDKSKADKLRYKVEDQVVRIFITPYRTSLSDKDLNFSQGDFNVDVVLALGVTEQQDLDTAITAHGRILHDATVASVSTQGQGSLGTINWVDPTTSSLSEMVVSLIDGLDKKIVDNQIATALLTGIVASTDRFSNDKTSPRTMSASAELMAAGANQQLIATELQAVASAPSPSSDEPPTSAEDSDVPEVDTKPPVQPGTLEINHPVVETESDPVPEPAPEPAQERVSPQVHVDENGQLVTLPDGQSAAPAGSALKRERMVEPPKMGDSELTANASPQPFDPPTEELSLPSLSSPMLTHNETVLPPDAAPAQPFAAPVSAPFVPPLPESMPPLTPSTTLTQIEQSVHSPHLQVAASEEQVAASSVDSARNAVEAALNHTGIHSDPLQPIAALNAQPLGTELHTEQIAPALFTPPPVANTGFSEPTPGNTPADDALDMPLPSNPFGPAAGSPLPPIPAASPSTFPGIPQANAGQTPPPPVPPPMLPPLQ